MIDYWSIIDVVPKNDEWSYLIMNYDDLIFSIIFRHDEFGGVPVSFLNCISGQYKNL